MKIRKSKQKQLNEQLKRIAALLQLSPEKTFELALKSLLANMAKHEDA